MTDTVPDAILSGMVPNGAVLRFYDQAGRIVLERPIADTRGTDWLRVAEAAAAVDAGLAGLALVLFDGDTGIRIPMTFGVVSQLRPQVMTNISDEPGDRTT